MRVGRYLLLVVACHWRAGAVWAADAPAFIPLEASAGVPLPAPPPPLGRRISLHLHEVSLQEALDRVATAARLRLTYSAEAVPLAKRVSASFDSASVGKVLSALLVGAAVQPVATGADHIVLVPVRVDAVSPAPITLDRVVVTGSAVGAAQRTLPVALDVLDGRQLAEGSVGTMALAVNAAIPGLWMWTQPPSSFMAQYGSVRGASSFGLSYPKVYIDGIEVANPLLITQLSPDAIERIEVIRGPQGAALYGGDAISGVTNILLRQGDADARRARLRSGFRVAASSYSPTPALGQEHGLSLRAGSNMRSAGLNLEAGTSGAFIPGGDARQVGASATARAVGTRTIVSGTLRLFGAWAGTPTSPLLPVLPPESGSGAKTAATAAGAQTVEEHTLGVNVKFRQSDWLTHAVVVGIDGYALKGVPNERMPIPSSVDAALVAARGGADRATLRGNSVLRLAAGRILSGAVTLLAEHSLLYEWAGAAPGVAVRTGSSASNAGQPGAWRNTSGFGGQINVGWFQQLFLTGGLRVERAPDVGRTPLLPMFGAAWVSGLGPLTLKLRGAYGRGMRWPQTTVRQTLGEGVRPGTADNVSLAPEEQSGVEGGVDLIVGRALTVQVTHFDQTATGLIQRVAIPVDTALPNGEVKRKIVYRPQNVGEIGNRGWELQASVRGGPLTIAGTLSLVDSRVRRVAKTYTGDLRAGDRMLEVPARTMSLSATWSDARSYATVTVYRAGGWVYYDRLTLAQRFAGGTRNFTGPALRHYWLDYSGVTHLRATLARELLYGVSLTLAVENLLNRQTGEPDNVMVLPGRTVTLGVRREF